MTSPAMQKALREVAQMGRDAAKDDYLTVLKTLVDQLQQPHPNPVVCRSCVEYIQQNRLPLDEIIVPAGAQWGNA